MICGRPKIPESEKRKSKISISFSLDERAWIERQATKAGIPLAVYIRAHILQESSAGVLADEKVSNEVIDALGVVAGAINRLRISIDSDGFSSDAIGYADNIYRALVLLREQLG